MIEPEVKVYAQSGLGYFVSYVDPFSKVIVKKRIGDREEAETYRNEIINQLSRKISDNPAEMLTRDLMRLYLQENPDGWLHKQKGLIGDFLESFGMLKLNEINTDMLRSWIDRLRIERKLKESTMFGKTVAINYFFRDLVKRGVLTTSPVMGIHYEKRDIEKLRKPIILTEDHLEELLRKAKAYSPGIFYPMLRTFIETGARSQEVIDLTWSAVDFKNGTITFPEGDSLLHRVIPISAELQDVLAKKRQVADLVFTSVYDEKMSKRKVAAYINDFKDHYGIKEKWMYFDLRHSLAYNFLASGGDLKKLQVILGIRDAATLRNVYIKRLVKIADPISPYEEPKNQSSPEDHLYG
jgi:integrase/recombinase XerD